MNKEKVNKLNARVTDKMKQDLEKTAKANNRELSDYLRLLFQYAIDKKLKF